MFLGKPLNGCFLENSVERRDKKSMQRSIDNYDQRKFRELPKFSKFFFPAGRL